MRIPTPGCPYRLDRAWALTRPFMVPSVYYLNTTDSSRRSSCSFGPCASSGTTTSYGTRIRRIWAGIRFNYDVTAKNKLGLSGIQRTAIYGHER